ncbi:hypothetical protein DICVIV_12127 [Dictyocaulus viviparus]|uniref:Uncharacterized protein n=1 Tax=Dictyocaulus viviparus TaxID=29172 RepID=A0A0D8XBD8_DICVI|nr:hypothetical protein DICVIV_12127 [Dictyocaulus viviparus]
MPSQSPTQAHPSPGPMQLNKPSPGSNRVVYSTNTIRPPSNGSGHIKSEPSPLGMQQTSGEQMSMNSGISGSTAMSPASCSLFGSSSQNTQTSDQGPPQPPNINTPFPLVTHYDMPPAFQHLQESFQMRNPALQMYYKRRKALLVLPYPCGPNLSNVAPVEPPTFAFLPHTKHYDVAYDRRYPTMNPVLQSQSGMHRQPIQSPQVMSPAFTQPQPPNKAKAPPAKKTRSDSTDSSFASIAPNSGMMMTPNCMPQRHIQQMPPDMLQHYGVVPTSQMSINPGGMQQYYPGASPGTVPTSSTVSVSNTSSMNMTNGMFPMGGVPHSAASMAMSRLPDMSQQMNDNRSQQVPVSGVFQGLSNGRMSTGDQQSLSSPRNQPTQPPYQPQGNQFDISPQCPKCLCLVSNCTGLLPRAFALLEEDPSAKWVCGACESSVL